MSGELAQADVESRSASNIGEPSDPLWAARFRVQRAKIWVYQGRYQDALTLLMPPLPKGLPDAAVAITRGTLLSIALKRTGDRDRAALTLMETEKLCPNESACAEVRSAQGIVYIESARLDDASRVFELGLADARAQGNKFLQIQVLVNLAAVALRQDRYEDALARLEAVSVLAKEIGAKIALEKATGGVGSAFYKLGDYRHALANSQLAAEQAAALGIPVDQARWLTDIGNSQSQLGDLAAARTSYEHALQLAHSISNFELTGDALVALASISLETGDLEDAFKRSREAEQIAAQRGNDSDALEPSLIEALVLEKQRKISDAKNQLVALEKKSSKKAFRWRVENALAQLETKTGDALSADSWFRRAIETFREQRSSVNDIKLRLPFVENGTGLYLSYMEYLIRQGKTGDALRILDEGRAETLSEPQTTLVPLAEAAAERAGRRDIRRPSAIAKRLDATILVYCLHPGASYLWAINSKRMDFIRLPGKEVIQPLIDNFTRKILSSKDVLAQQDDSGYELYRNLVEPAQSLIAPGGTVFIIADQGMNGLNFETLLTSSTQPHFWIEDVNILNARSLGLLSKSQEKPLTAYSQKRLLLIGDPIYSSQEYERLPHAREEMDRVEEHFAPTQRLVITGAAATPSAYKLSQPAHFSYIHFVAHGIANSMVPLDSAVVLSASVKSEESYKLYARDVLDQKLNADLVTISSCFGSGVQSYAGEGLVGLTWAFLHAGSHNVVGALWEVDDASTPRLMNDLYDGLARGNTPSNALRSAKLAMIRSGGVFRKPFYWAPFQLYAGT